MRPGAQRAMDAWGLLGGYHLEGLGVVTIRDTLAERAE